MTTESKLTGFQISPQQRRLWSLGLEGHELLVQRGAWLSGAAGAEPEDVRRVATAVLGAHEAMRTTFRRPSGIKFPLQVVAEEQALDWRVAEGDGAEDDGEALEALCAQEREEGFDPEEGPVVRVACLPASDGPPGLVITASALVADGRSLELLFDTVAHGLATSGDPEPQVPVQHAQFSEWQHQVAGGQDEDELADSSASASLPFLRPHDAPAGERPVVHRESLPAALASRVSKLAGAADERANLFMAAWAVLLRSLVGSDELTIGCRFPVRPVDDLAGVVGPLAKVVPTTVRLRGDFHFSEVRKRAREALRHATERQETFSWPSTRGHNGSEPRLALAFEITENAPEGGSEPTGAREHTWTEPCDLVLAVAIRGDSIDLTYYGSSEDRVSPRDLELLALRFRGLLGALVEEGDPIVEEAERRLHPAERKMLLGFAIPEAAVEAADAPDADLLDGFRRAVKERPSEPALVVGDESLDYATLGRRSDAVATALRRAGIGPQTLVGLWADRSAAAIVGMLGILEGGAAFVPLDPALPLKRLLRIADEVDLEILVAGSDPPEALTEGRRVVSSASAPSSVPEASDPQREAKHDGQLAYLLFTSGSSGQPKAVSVARAHLASYVREIVERLELAPGERFASVSTLAADLGNTMVFPALATGGTLVLFSPQEIGDPQAFVRAVAEHRIDNLKIVPTHLSALLQEEDAEAILPAKRLIVGGERTPLHLAERVLRASSCAVHNHYGPTETTIGATTQDARSWWDDPRSATVPIGRPLAETRVHVVDEALRTVPLWASGEIAIGGTHVARGYHGRPAETAERFVPDPLVDEPDAAGARLYRTGDMGRVLGDGALEFLGRLDRQLKIRGFRVEIGEIETVLCGHPSVDTAVVVPRQQHDDEHLGVRLVGYVVPADETGAGDVGDLQSYLRRELPAFMIPQTFETLDALPRTPNGKIDVSALPEPGSSETGGERPYLAPRNPVEELVAELWSKLLGRGRVGVHDDFFEVGGHSLLAMQLLSRLRKTFSVDLPLPVIFERTTVAELAATLEEQEPSPGHVEKVARVHMKVRDMSADRVDAELGARAGAGGESLG